MAERVFLTGAGMVGAQIIKILNNDYQIKPVVLDLQFQLDYLDTVLDRDSYVAVQGSVLDRALVAKTLKDHGITRIIHAAAVLPMRVGHDPHPGFFEVNTWGSINLLFTAVDCGVTDFVMFSTNGVYQFRSNPITGPIPEDFPSGLTDYNSYGSSKATAECLIREMTNLGKIRGRVVRPGEIFGPVMNRGDDEPIFWKAMFDAAIDGRPYVLKGHPEHRLDWVYCKDVARLATLVAMTEAPNNAYHASYGKVVGIYDLKDALDKIFPGNQVTLEDCARGGWNHPLSMNRAKEDLDFVPQFDFEKGIQDYTEWYRSVKSKAGSA